jgi:hypothetical protein
MTAPKQKLQQRTERKLAAVDALLAGKLSAVDRQKALKARGYLRATLRHFPKLKGLAQSPYNRVDSGQNLGAVSAGVGAQIAILAK